MVSTKKTFKKEKFKDLKKKKDKKNRNKNIVNINKKISHTEDFDADIKIEADLINNEPQNYKKNINNQSIDSLEEVKTEGLGEFSFFFDEYKPSSTLHVTPEAFSIKWNELLTPEAAEFKPVPLAVRKKLRSFAKTIYDNDLKIFKGSEISSGSQDFHKDIFVEGTTKDQIYAHSLSCMKAPFFGIKHLFEIMEFLLPQFKNDCVETIKKIGELFKTVYLTSNRPVREFEVHDFNALLTLAHEDRWEAETQLVLWFVEAQVRSAFAFFVNKLSELSQSQLSIIKVQAIHGLERLVMNLPFQNPNHVITALARKFGDENRISGMVLAGLTKLIELQPDTRMHVLAGIEEVYYNQIKGSKSDYYCLCLLSHMLLREKDFDRGVKVMNIFISAFKIHVSKGNVDDVFMVTLLRGLRRGLRVTKDHPWGEMDELLDVLYKVSHLSSNFRVTEHILDVLYCFNRDNKNKLSDRFYMVMYRDVSAMTSHTQPAKGRLFNVVYKSLLEDVSKHRIAAFTRRMLQYSKLLPAQYSCAVLFMISEIVLRNHALADLNDIMNLPSVEGADTKKIFETPCEKTMSSQERSNLDAVLAKAERIKKKRKKHQREEEEETVWAKTYDPYKLQPKFAGALLIPTYEMVDFLRHFHPAVQHLSSNLARFGFCTHLGDPIQDFSLMQFLDRFTNKAVNSKKKEARKMWDPASYAASGPRSFPIESDTFRGLQPKDVPSDDLFFYNYFTKYSFSVMSGDIMKKKQAKKERRLGLDSEEGKKRKREDDDDDGSDEDLNDDAFEKHLDKHQMFKVPDEEADDLDDLDFSSMVTHYAGPQQRDEQQFDERPKKSRKVTIMEEGDDEFGSSNEFEVSDVDDDDLIGEDEAMDENEDEATDNEDEEDEDDIDFDDSDDDEGEELQKQPKFEEFDDNDETESEPKGRLARKRQALQNRGNQGHQNFRGQGLQGFRGRGDQGFRGRGDQGFRGRGDQGFRGRGQQGYRGRGQEGHREEGQQGFRGRGQQGFRGRGQQGFRSRGDQGFRSRGDQGFRGQSRGGRGGGHRGNYHKGQNSS